MKKDVLAFIITLSIVFLCALFSSCTKENLRFSEEKSIIGKWYEGDPTFWDIEINPDLYKIHTIYNTHLYTISYMNDTIFIYHPFGEKGTLDNSRKVRYWVEGDSMWWNRRNTKAHFTRF